MKNNIKGVGVALVTPFFADGAVDYSSLEALIEHVTEGTVDYLVALGTTAETPTLTPEEKDAIIRFVVEKNNGRLPVVAGVGGNSTAAVVESLKTGDFSGVDAILSVTPYYNKPTQEGLFRHYMEVADASPVPVILYNVPGRTGVNMSAQTTLRLATSSGNIMGIKEACGIIPQMARLIQARPEGFKVICGDDCFAIPLVSMGGDGIISVAANAYPKILADMVREYERGNRAEASRRFMSMLEMFEALFEEGNPAGIKAVLSLKGICPASVRLPLVEASAGLTRKLSGLMQKYSL